MVMMMMVRLVVGAPIRRDNEWIDILELDVYSCMRVVGKEKIQCFLFLVGAQSSSSSPLDTMPKNMRTTTQQLGACPQNPS